MRMRVSSPYNFGTQEVLKKARSIARRFFRKEVAARHGVTTRIFGPAIPYAPQCQECRVSLFLISALFGFSHYQQGPTGIIEEGSDGLILGLIYLAWQRNLAIPIVVHGVCDTIDVVLLFLGKYRG